MSESDENNTFREEKVDAKETLSNTSETSANEENKVPQNVEYAASEHGSSDTVDAVIDVKKFDPVLARKMALVNEAIDEIGMSSFQWKLLLLNGFGYAVDSVCHHFYTCPFISARFLLNGSLTKWSSCLLFANQLRTQLFNKNTVYLHPRSLGSLWHRRSAY